MRKIFFPYWVTLREHTYFSNQEEHSGSIWPCVILSLYHFKYTHPIEIFFRFTSNNVESTDVVIKCPHSQNYYAQKNYLKKQDFVKTIQFLIFRLKIYLNVSWMYCDLKKKMVLQCSFQKKYFCCKWSFSG